MQGSTIQPKALLTPCSPLGEWAANWRAPSGQIKSKGRVATNFRGTMRQVFAFPV